jgi:phage terminase small subunit
VNNLSIKEAKFVNEYLIDENGTRAAIAAGYAPKSASVTACRLLKNAKIQAALAKELSKTLGKLEITREKVLGGIAQLAYYDPRKFFNEDGSTKKITELDDQTVMALSGFEITELFGENGPIGQTKKFKIADRGINLERLARHLKLFTEKQEHSGPGGGPIPVANITADDLTDSQLAAIIAGEK